MIPAQRANMWQDACSRDKFFRRSPANFWRTNNFFLPANDDNDVELRLVASGPSTQEIAQGRKINTQHNWDVQKGSW